MLKHLKDFKSFILLESVRVEKIDPSSYEQETVTQLPYSEYIEDNRNEFLKKLIRISKDLKIDPLWLLHTIFHESRFDPKCRDNISGAVGLIAFLPSTLKAFINSETGKGYTPNDIIEMSNVDQLDIIKAFYKSWISELNLDKEIAPGDFAAITFYPETIRKDWEWKFPKYLIEKNSETFKKISSGEGKTKKDYYKYIEEIFNSDYEQDDENNYILGNFTGAFADPESYREKKPLEYYRGILDSIENPNMTSGIQPIDLANTESGKQIIPNTAPLGINTIK